MESKLISLLGLIFLLALPQCSKNSLSERDSRREQLTSSSDIKRRELQQVAGEYEGVLKSSTIEQKVTLTLDIKDVPVPVEGQVDPVPTPTLSGYLKFYLGSDIIGFGIQKADYQTSGRLDLIVENVQYKEIKLNLTKQENTLEGTWVAPSLSEKGTTKFSKISGGNK